MVSRTKAWSQELGNYRDPFIEECLSNNDRYLDTQADSLELDRRYLKIQVRLHIPFFSTDQRQQLSFRELVDKTLRLISERTDNTSEIESWFAANSGAQSIRPGSYIVSISRDGDTLIRHREDTSYELKVNFQKVSNEIGKRIQTDLHYIHSHREDTLDHFGFFVEGYELPFCYAAVSLCDREYQRAPLRNILPGIKDNAVLSMTRAYSFPPLPKNSMSKLFQETARFYAAQRQYGAMVTAINPLLGFKGSTFLGSSFIPYATSPMQYVYTDKGHYVNRRHPDATSVQKCKTPSIVWLARGLTRSYQAILERQHSLHSTSKSEYDQG